MIFHVGLVYFNSKGLIIELNLECYLSYHWYCVSYTILIPQHPDQKTCIWQLSERQCQKNTGVCTIWNRWNLLNSALISNWRDKTYGIHAPIGLHNVNLLSNKKREFFAVTIPYNEQREGGVTNRRNWQRLSGWRVRVQWWVAGFHNTVCTRLNAISMFGTSL